MGKHKKNRLREFSKVNDVLLRDIAKNAELTPQALCNIMNGTSKDMHLSTAIRLKRITGLNPHEYLTIPGYKYKADIEIL